MKIGGTNLVKIERALISVSNKDGIVDFARGLKAHGVEIISTGGTAALLDKSGIKTVNISDVTGFPEMLDGRVKTLHPNIHAGLLARRDLPEHMEQLGKMGIKKIDMVVVNLYPFRQTVLKPNVSLEEIIENIDIGGPSMIRAASKNYGSVAVVTDPASYKPVLDEMNASGGSVGGETLKRLMLEAFRSTAAYDSMIAQYLGGVFPTEQFPHYLTLGMEKVQDLRYGENPSQAAAFYADPFTAGVAVSKMDKLHGKEISFNNVLDVESALSLLREFEDRACAVVIKHTNPCGIACDDNIYDAFITAYNVDPLAAFGCVIGLNRECDVRTAEEISKHFVEMVMAPSFEPAALDIMMKKKNIRLLRTNQPITLADAPKIKMKYIKGGMLVQTADNSQVTRENLRVVTKRQPTEEEIKAMLFANRVVKHIWSNTVILAKGERVVGIGAGQMSRVDSSFIAGHKAGENAKGSVMASDAFFPFRDGVDEAAKAGATAIIQPGGSIRDEEVIQAANEHDMAMVFSGARVFRH
ncbi:bifunctional phosphoribosylaminoimidazolecarboxamide formyltransferase/IMP cyclohydrolase [Methanomassiliicoccus luminyensis]|uniref:bifunctional phosphoribosylaminoimidazolecarboxamide formyltransferase/IMP cyclohydrolase n=1 Tax=Methanomassiliicoccus luminyensis TaxID=1080712 RepID=UPI00037ACC28